MSLQGNNHKNPSRNSIILLIISILLAIVAAYLIYDNKFKKDEYSLRESESSERFSKEEEEDNSSNEMSEKTPEFSKSQVLDLMSSYYSDVRNGNFNAYKYYSNRNIQFIGKYDLTPSDINNIFNSENEYLDQKIEILNKDVNYVRSSSSVHFYTFWAAHQCYRNSRRQYQTCNVNIEIGLDNNMKIRSYKEKEIKNLKFHDYNPEETPTMTEEYTPGYYTVSGDIDGRAYFHNSPTYSSIRKAYLIEGEVVYVQMVQDGFGYIEFVNSSGQKSKGWVDLSLFIKR